MTDTRQESQGADCQVQLEKAKQILAELRSNLHDTNKLKDAALEVHDLHEAELTRLRAVNELAQEQMRTLNAEAAQLRQNCIELKTELAKVTAERDALRLDLIDEKNRQFPALHSRPSPAQKEEKCSDRHTESVAGVAVAGTGNGTSAIAGPIIRTSPSPEPGKGEMRDERIDF